MLTDGLEWAGGAPIIDFYMNEQPCKKYASYVNPGTRFSALNFQPIYDLDHDLYSVEGNYILF